MRHLPGGSLVRDPSFDSFQHSLQVESNTSTCLQSNNTKSYAARGSSVESAKTPFSTFVRSTESTTDDLAPRRSFPSKPGTVRPGPLRTLNQHRSLFSPDSIAIAVKPQSGIADSTKIPDFSLSNQLTDLRLYPDTLHFDGIPSASAFLGDRKIEVIGNVWWMHAESRGTKAGRLISAE